MQIQEPVSALFTNTYRKHLASLDIMKISMACRKQVTERQLLMYETDYGTTVLSLESLFDNVRKRHVELIRAEVAGPITAKCLPSHSYFGPQPPQTLCSEANPSQQDHVPTSLPAPLEHSPRGLAQMEGLPADAPEGHVGDGKNFDDGFNFTSALNESLQEGADLADGCGSAQLAGISVENVSVNDLLAQLPAPAQSYSELEGSVASKSAYDPELFPSPDRRNSHIPGVPALATASESGSQGWSNEFESFEAMLIHGALSSLGACGLSFVMYRVAVLLSIWVPRFKRQFGPTCIKN
jgi:hypothetical protein